MDLQKLKIAILDEIHTIISDPVLDPDEIRDTVNRLFQEVSVGEKQTA
jgi:hypothetical protein